MRRWILSLVLMLAACSYGAEAGSLDGTPGNNTNNSNNGILLPEDCPDADGDTICDVSEGSGDADGDGIPNTEDTDSDGDGIPDADEAGDSRHATPPADSDEDGTPDFLDTDSDNNGIPDADEPEGDADGDLKPDFADTDDDNDYIPDSVEVGDDPSSPVDTDGDGMPDYHDTDSDNDGVGDLYEQADDADGDGVANFRDTDSDDDGIDDSVESGTEGDIDAAPWDTDDDGNYDFLDVDSDNDGLADASEDANHNGVVDDGETDPLNPDTDGDGVSDLIEAAAETDPLDADDNPQEMGDFVFLIPYMKDPSPSEDTLDFSTAFNALDMLFVEDVSESMRSEISSIKHYMSYVMGQVICAPGEDPVVTHCIPDVESGVLTFYEQNPAYTLVKSIDDNNLIDSSGPNETSTEYLLPGTVNVGGSERHLQALYGAVDGDCASDPSRIGQTCFRPGALHLVLLVTDEDFREDEWYQDPNQTQSVYDALHDAGVKLILVHGKNDAEIPNLIQDVEAMQSGGETINPALDTSNLRIPSCQGMSFVDGRAIVPGADTAAGMALTCAVQAVGAYMPQDVEAWVLNGQNNVDSKGNSVDAPEAFIDYVEVFMVDGDGTCPAGYNTLDLDGDGHDDKFQQVLPGSPVCWKIHVKQNSTVPASDEPQMFEAVIEVHGAGGALLDTRSVYFLVPPDVGGPGAVD